ncbi:MAG: phosphatase PAP2 family protein [Desulfitobacteriaceae bacterium]
MAKQKFFPYTISLLLLPLGNSFYFLLNHTHGHVYDLSTSLDRSIPFIKYLVVPYMIWYPMVIGAMLWLLYRNPRVYATTLVSCLAGLAISYGIFTIVQTTTPRPYVTGTDFFAQFTSWLYRTDNPYNSFPSIHVLICFILFFAYNRIALKPRRLTLVIQGLAVLISLSTLLIKQHTIADVVSGIVLAWLLLRGAEMVFALKPEK